MMMITIPRPMNLKKRRMMTMPNCRTSERLWSGKMKRPQRWWLNQKKTQQKSLDPVHLRSTMMIFESSWRSTMLLIPRQNQFLLKHSRLKQPSLRPAAFLNPPLISLKPNRVMCNKPHGCYPKLLQKLSHLSKVLQRRPFWFLEQWSIIVLYNLKSKELRISESLSYVNKRNFSMFSSSYHKPVRTYTSTKLLLASWKLQLYQVMMTWLIVIAKLTIWKWKIRAIRRQLTKWDRSKASLQ